MKENRIKNIFTAKKYRFPVALSASFGGLLVLGITVYLITAYVRDNDILEQQFSSLLENKIHNNINSLITYTGNGRHLLVLIQDPTKSNWNNANLLQPFYIKNNEKIIQLFISKDTGELKLNELHSTDIIPTNYREIYKNLLSSTEINDNYYGVGYFVISNIYIENVEYIAVTVNLQTKNQKYGMLCYLFNKNSFIKNTLPDNSKNFHITIKSSNNKIIFNNDKSRDTSKLNYNAIELTKSSIWYISVTSNINWLTILKKYWLVYILIVLLIVVIFFVINYFYNNAIVLEKHYSEKLLSVNSELLKANENKDRLFSIVSHDLRNPISAILNVGEMLQEYRHKMSPEQLDKQITLLNKSVVLTKNLLENLLEWSRINMGGIRYEPAMNDLIVAAQNAKDELFAQSVAKIITISIKTDLKEAKCIFDNNMINTVIRNILSNAIKFSEKESVIQINIIDKEEYFQCEICDKGVGMTEEQVKKAFTNDNASTTGTEGEKGSGLGLSIIKEFIHKHNSKIWVTSELGKGSTFIFTLNKTR